ERSDIAVLLHPGLDLVNEKLSDLIDRVAKTPMSVQIVARLVKSGSRNDLDFALARNANECVRISADADGRGVDYRSTAERVKLRQLFDCLFGVVQAEIRFFDDDQVAADHHVLMSIRDA